MSYLRNKTSILKDAFMGNLMKLKVIYDIRLRKAMTLSSQRDNSVVISLTSYGKRVERSAVFTIYSLLRQTIRPERVVLWLNEEEYNSRNLPNDLRFLCDYGLEVGYGKDIGPYTKIIHSLKTFRLLSDRPTTSVLLQRPSDGHKSSGGRERHPAAGSVSSLRHKNL